MTSGQPGEVQSQPAITEDTDNRIRQVAVDLCAMVNRLRVVPGGHAQTDANGFHPVDSLEYQVLTFARAVGRNPDLLYPDQPGVIALAENLVEWMSVPFTIRDMPKHADLIRKYDEHSIAVLCLHQAHVWAHIADFSTRLAQWPGGTPGEETPGLSIAEVWKVRPVCGYGSSSSNPVPLWLGDALVGDVRRLDVLGKWFETHATPTQATAFHQRIVEPWAMWRSRFAATFFRREYVWPGISSDAKRLAGGSEWLVLMAHKLDPQAKDADEVESTTDVPGCPAEVLPIVQALMRAGRKLTTGELKEILGFDPWQRLSPSKGATPEVKSWTARIRRGRGLWGYP